MEFLIRKNIPKPTVVGNGRGRQVKYPFEQLEVGDSFLICETSGPKEKSRASSAITGAHRRFPTRKFSSRVDASGAISIWRDADLAEPRKPRVK